MEPSEKLLYTRVEAAEMLSFSVATLDVAIARGMLRARRNGRRVMIEKREIERFSRADHPHIWAPDGKRGTSLAGRECFDCARRHDASFGASERRPAVRFLKRLPLCQECFDARRSDSAPKTGAMADSSAEALAEAR
jgi:Helix-turn-helix domain